MTRLAIILASSILVVGCGSFVPVVQVESLSPEEKQGLRSVSILSESRLLHPEDRVIGIVEGHSCQNKVWDKPATRSGAIEQLQYFAFEMGADAIANIRCGGREGTSIRTNCWELISCTAEAVRLAEQSR